MLHLVKTCPAATLLLLALSFIMPSHGTAGPVPVKIGVASMITPVDTVKYYQEIVDYIGEQLGQPVQMVHRRTYSEMDSMLEKGEVKIAFVCSAPYVRDRERFGVELLAAPSVDGNPLYYSYIIVHKDSPIKSFPELKGKVFAFVDPGSNSGKLYPTYLLMTMGYTPENFFEKFLYSYSHNKSVEMVAKKLADGASVDSLVYRHMVKSGSPYSRQTKVIKRSHPFGIPPVVVTKDIDPTLRKKVKEALLRMKKTSRGTAILKGMMIDGFVEVSDNKYDTIRDMDRAVSGYASTLPQAKDRKTVFFGVIPKDNPRIMYEKYQPLLDYLEEKTPYKFELVLKKNYEDTVKALGRGELDVALLGPLTYLEAHASFGAVSILKSKGANGTSSYKSVIIKKKESQIKNLSELKGKSVAFAASRSTSGNLIPRYLLANSGIHLSELAGYTNFSYHDSVVKAVLKGQYDVGAVRDSVARKYMKLGIDAIAESGPIPTGPLVVGPGTPPLVTKAISKALLELDPRDSGDQSVLGRLDEDYRNGFVVAEDGDYGDIRTKINAIPRTCGMSCHPKIKL